MTGNDGPRNLVKFPETPKEKKPDNKRVVVLPVYSTKVMAGLETDETLSRVKRVKRKKRLERHGTGQKNRLGQEVEKDE